MSSVQLIKGRNGGLYYEKNGKKIYVTNVDDIDSQMRSQAQPSSGWSAMAPKKGPERARLYEECDAKGQKCFLGPNAKNPGISGFPICPACRDPNVPCSCRPNCKGIVAAYARGRQWKHVEQADKARELEMMYGCSKSALSTSSNKISNQIGGMNLDQDLELPGSRRRNPPASRNLQTGLLYESKGRFSQAYCPQTTPCPPNKPLRYKMRGRSEYCCRARPEKRVGPRRANAYIEFLSAHKGQGYSREELLEMYKQLS